MLHVSWKEAYKVDHPLIDQQHESLVGILNRLIDIASVRSLKSEVSTLFHELIEYAHVHFSTEEQLLDRVNYPQLVKQKAAHRAFIAKLISLNREYDADDEEMLKEMITFLKQWYVSHIMDMDHQYASAIKGLGETSDERQYETVPPDPLDEGH